MSAVVAIADRGPARNGRRVISLPSRGFVELPITDLIVDGKLDVYPHVEELGVLFLQLRRNVLTLTAGPYIGLIPLTPTVLIDVRPKLPISNFARVLDAARGSLSAITGADRLYLSNDLASNSVLEFVAANLLNALRPVHQNGLLKDYVRVSETTGSPRGRIDLSATMTRTWSRGLKHKVIAQRFEQTSDIPVNRVIKTALRTAVTRIKAQNDTSRELIVALNRAFFDLPTGIGDMSAGDFAIAKHMLMAKLLPDARAYYGRALEIAIMIMSNRGIALQDQGTDVVLDSFIVNFEVMFEDYLRRVLQTRSDPAQVRVRDGNREGKKYLFDDKKDSLAQPDIVVSSIATGKTIIAEVKYKEKPKREDYNQAITYAVAYRANRSILVHQNAPGAGTGLRHIGTMNGIVLDAYAFDLSNVDLAAEESAFANLILSAVM
jgi:5-methylcytosine-specific restriction enzyme subunit McrC